MIPQGKDNALVALLHLSTWVEKGFQDAFRHHMRGQSAQFGAKSSPFSLDGVTGNTSESRTVVDCGATIEVTQFFRIYQQGCPFFFGESDCAGLQ